MPGQPPSQEAQLAFMAQQMELQLNTLIEKNTAGFADLQRRGIRFDPGQLLSARIDTLIGTISSVLGPQGPLWALQARLDWEQVIEAQIVEAGRQGQQAQLAAGGSFTPAMIRQLAAETGTLGFLRG